MTFYMPTFVVPPVVTANPSLVSQKIGYETRLFCHVSSKPQSTVAWYVGDNQIDETDRLVYIHLSPPATMRTQTLSHHDSVVLEKVAIYFLHILGMYFSTFQHCSSIYLLFHISRHMLLPICKLALNSSPYGPIYLLVLNLQSSDIPVDLIADNFKMTKRGG